MATATRRPTRAASSHTNPREVPGYADAPRAVQRCIVQICATIRRIEALEKRAARLGKKIRF